MLKMNRAVLLAMMPALMVAAVALAGLMFDTYVQYVICLCLVATIAGVALVPLVGYAKIVMLAGGAMMGIGAYASSLLVIKQGVPFLVAVGFAAVCGGLAGFILGIPSTRFRGHHLAMVTLVFQSLGIIILREWKSMTGGAEGIRVPKAEIFGWVIATDARSLIMLGVFSSVCVFLMGILLKGRFGNLLKAITATEVGSVAFGVNPGAVKVAAFALTSAFLAVAGALIAPQLKIIDPESFGFTQSINSIAYSLVGGMQSVWGGVVGGLLLRALPEALRSFADYAEVVFTCLALLIILRLPDGLVGGAVAVFRRLFPLQFVREFEAPGQGPMKTGHRPLSVSVGAFEPEVLGLALKVSEVRKSYGSLVAVAEVSLRVESGRIHGLIGPNGAGKTTLFNMISGLTKPDSGYIEMFGASTIDVPAVRRLSVGLTRTFQHLAIFGQLTCIENVLIGLGENKVVHSMVRSFSDMFEGPDYMRRHELAIEALDAVGLRRRAFEKAGTLSLGDQRRLEIARAIVSRPRLLLLDEPVSGIDPTDELRLMALLRRLNTEWKLTMLLIEHNIRFVVGCSDELTVMHQGSVVAEGKPEEVIKTEQVQQIYFGRKK